jgi:acyl-homoserine lactone synthase
MMEVLTGIDRARYPHLFSRMHSQRHEIYVERRGWKGLHSENGEERDQFDRADTIYLLAIDEEDDILAGLRLLPTAGSHLLGDVFPHLVMSGDVPRGDDILELTRFYVAPFGANRQVRDWLVGVLCTGMIEYCLDHGVTQITSVIDTFLLKLMLSMEWKVRPLGLPQRYAEGTAVAVVAEITDAALESTRRTKRVEGPVLRPALIAPSRIPASVRLGDGAVRNGRAMQ